MGGGVKDASVPDNEHHMDERWRELRVGQRVRFVQMPGPEFRITDPETLAVYRALVDAAAVVAVEEIDDYGKPWTEPFDIEEDGRVHVTSGIGHTLALDDDSWELAEGEL